MVTLMMPWPFPMEWEGQGGQASMASQPLAAGGLTTLYCHFLLTSRMAAFQ